MLIAYVIKFAVVRIGGTQAYTSYLLPGAVGYLLGTAGIWGFTLVSIMIPSIFSFLLFNSLIEQIYYALVFGIWVLSLLGIIAFIIASIAKK
jgi:hypothetical protein